MSKETAMAMISPAVPLTPAPKETVVQPPVAPVEGVNSSGAAASTETKPQPETKPTVADERLKHLGQKEAQLQAQREQIKKDREAYEADRVKLKEANDQFNKFNELKKTNPVEAFKMLGFTETDFINWAASAGVDTRTPAEIAAETARAEIQKDRDAQAQREAEAKEVRNKEVLAKFDKDITDHVTSKKDDYEFLNFYGKAAEELIKEYVTQVLEKDNELISIEEAAKAVEEYYFESAMAMKSLKKFNPAPKEEPTTETKQPERSRVVHPPKDEEPPKQAPKTISSRVTATTAASSKPVHETREQKRQRLIDKLGSLGK